MVGMSSANTRRNPIRTGNGLVNYIVPRINMVKLMLLLLSMIVLNVKSLEATEDENPPASWSWFGERDDNDERKAAEWALVSFDELKEDIPIIIWWTERLFDSDDTKTISCPKSRCYSTKERKYAKDPRGRGFYFYGTDLDPEDVPLPRLSHHEWALFHEESPMNNFILVHAPMINLFNHTATFKRESDFPLTTNSLYSIKYLTERKPQSLKLKNKFRHEGLSPILYVQSHDGVPSDRDRYVEELMKHIDVDSYGACLNNKKMPSHLQDPVESMESPEFLDFIARYKFHLSFENAVCDDYITEKLFRPLHVGSVPIHMGTKKAKDWMPNNRSVILVDDFDSPADLASYIKFLDSDDAEYDKFLQFKETGITNKFLKYSVESRGWLNDKYSSQNDMIHSFECHICDKIFERHLTEKLHKEDNKVPLLPPRIAHGSHLYCPQPHTSIGDTYNLPPTDRWAEALWIEDYWGSLDKAMALRKMIDLNETDSSNFIKYWGVDYWTW